MTTSNLDLEKMAAGEKDTPASSSAAVAALQADNARVLQRLPPKSFAARVLSDAEKERERNAPRPASLVAIPAFAVAAAVVLFVAQPQNGGDRLKGDEKPQLMIAKKESAAATPTALLSGDRVSPGDVVQLSLRAPQRFGVVVSVDGRGDVTRHFPDGEKPTDLPRGLTVLPFSLELDDAPKFERFFFVAADQPVDVKDVERAAKFLGASKDPRAASLLVPPGTVVTDFLLVKE